MNEMYYCLDCPGPISGEHRGRCPFCGSDNVAEADYEPKSGKWLPLTKSGSFRKGDWLDREQQREVREALEDGDGCEEISLEELRAIEESFNDDYCVECSGNAYDDGEEIDEDAYWARELEEWR